MAIKSCSNLSVLHVDLHCRGPLGRLLNQAGTTFKTSPEVLSAILYLDRPMVYLSATDIPVSEVKAQLTDLGRRAEAGDEIILTRHGHPAVGLMPVKSIPDRATRKALLGALREAGKKAAPGP